MLDEAGEGLHQPQLEGALRFGNAAPRRHRLGARRQDRVRRDPAQLLLPREHSLAVGIPAVVELALVLVGPFPGHLVRAVARTRRPVEEEGLVGREGAVPAQPVDAALRQVFAQVVLRVVRRLDGVGVLHQPRLPLRGLAGQEAVEVVEAVAGGPAVEGAHRRGLVGRRVVPLADRRRAVAVVAQHLGDGGRGLRDHAGVAVPVHRALGDGAVAHALVVAPGEQRGARRRADRRGVEGVVADALVGQAAERGRLDLAAEGRSLAEADVVEQDDQHVRRAGLQVLRLGAALVHRVLQPRLGDAGRRHRRERQHRAVGRRSGGVRGMAVQAESRGYAHSTARLDRRVCFMSSSLHAEDGHVGLALQEALACRTRNRSCARCACRCRAGR